MATREVPILFSAPMVRAILEGRKTQTRRIVKERLHDPLMERAFAPGCGAYRGADGREVRPRWGRGDLLWVRETWARLDDAHEKLNRDMAPPEARAMYRADHSYFVEPMKWRPSIHMPKWAARIWLTVESVRVERLHDISEEDAKAEGVDSAAPHDYGSGEFDDDDREDPREVGYSPAGGSFARDNFRRLWRSINGPESWDLNPWVWVVTFRRTERTAVAA